jgi:hypothetical protein
MWSEKIEIAVGIIEIIMVLTFIIVAFCRDSGKGDGNE